MVIVTDVTIAGFQLFNSLNILDPRQAPFEFSQVHDVTSIFRRYATLGISAAYWSSKGKTLSRPADGTKKIARSAPNSRHCRNIVSSPCTPSTEMEISPGRRPARSARL